jgi:hypothetical protein
MNTKICWNTIKLEAMSRWAKSRWRPRVAEPNGSETGMPPGRSHSNLHHWPSENCHGQYKIIYVHLQRPSSGSNIEPLIAHHKPQTNRRRLGWVLWEGFRPFSRLFNLNTVRNNHLSNDQCSSGDFWPVTGEYSLRMWNFARPAVQWCHIVQMLAQVLHTHV